MGHNQIIAVVGATATGKSALALELAARFDGELVNADSRQVYRGMTIGTAKPAAAERARVPHHLVDIRDPDQTFSLAEFLDAARIAIDDTRGRGRLPIVVGGTGQYVRALLEGWQAPSVAADEAFRARLLARAQVEGPATLYEELRRADPAAAASIDPRNLRRVVRALEVIEATGRPFSAQRTRRTPPYDALTLGLWAEREALYAAIDARVEAMFAAGLVEEVRALLAQGYACSLPAMASIGYAEVCGYLSGALTLAEAIERTKTSTHRLARAQGAWFRRADARIDWLDVTAGVPLEAAAALVTAFLERDAAGHTAQPGGRPDPYRAAPVEEESS